MWNAKTMLTQIELIYEAVGSVTTNGGQGLIMIDGFYQLDEKSVEVLFSVLQRRGGTAGGGSNPGVAVSAMAKSN